MDLSYSEEHQRFRAEVQAFLKANWTPGSSKPTSDEIKAFRRKAIEAGYLYRGIPREYGGSEQAPDVLKGQIVREAFARVKAPGELSGVGVSMVVPTLLERGTPEQKARFIPPTMSGEVIWAQGYSEPGAGSDLASLRTRAELVDGEWVINGQKTWSSLAHKARYMFVLCRTEPHAPKHKGISYLLVDIRQPGITVRPMKQITGESEFCEVFFDNARTPADWIVGARGDGWAVSKTTLGHERAGFMGNAEASVALFDKLVDLARRSTFLGHPALQHPLIRERLAVLQGTVLAARYSGYRQLSMISHGEDPGIAPMLNKITASNIAAEIAAIARDLMGDALLLAPDPAHGPVGNERWSGQFFGSLGMAIAGGTSNIQRNLIAERGLGLPRDNAGANE
ncbi:acyl-CoA dehydrogenase family protein [Paraburkholderia sp.]|jgi:alkylation response protein AidB-like acyl-CoA dehydrogenase|uniref:acyl-CoA dehydrogenase family protein n=1 Tax=Paraburkholderia sp. TaxID=1926495 RepID=UPI002F41838D